MKFLVTTLLASAVAVGAWTLKEVIELKVAVAEVKRDVTHLAARVPAVSPQTALQSEENQKSELRSSL